MRGGLFWIQATAGKFGFYAEGSSPAVARAVPFAELFHQHGFTTGGQAHAGSLYHAIQGSELIHPIQSPPTLDHRYLHEDVGWGLVPWIHLAVAAGSPAPTITALTHLAGVINGNDYSRQGLTLERMGLAGKTPAQIRAHVSTPCRTGRRPRRQIPRSDRRLSSPHRKRPIRAIGGELNAALAHAERCGLQTAPDGRFCADRPQRIRHQAYAVIDERWGRGEQHPPPCQVVFIELDGLTRFPTPLLPVPI